MDETLFQFFNNLISTFSKQNFKNSLLEVEKRRNENGEMSVESVSCADIEEKDFLLEISMNELMELKKFKTLKKAILLRTSAAAEDSQHQRIEDTQVHQRIEINSLLDLTRASHQISLYFLESTPLTFVIRWVKFDQPIVQSQLVNLVLESSIQLVSMNNANVISNIKEDLGWTFSPTNLQNPNSHIVHTQSLQDITQKIMNSSLVKLDDDSTLNLFIEPKTPNVPSILPPSEKDKTLVFTLENVDQDEELGILITCI